MDEKKLKRIIQIMEYLKNNEIFIDSKKTIAY